MTDEIQTTKTPITTSVTDDFIPLPKSELKIPTPTETIVTKNKPSLTDKLKLARLAMQGPERTIKRERNERERQIDKEKNELDQALALLTKKKEDLEIGWVVLDNKRIDLKKMLAPLLEEEERIETEEEELEGKERTAPSPSDRQKLEKERWALQDKRKEIEKQKWGFEDRIIKVENLIKENTDKYQVLLDEEEVIVKKLDDLDSELSLMAEQLRLEVEEAKRKIEITQAEKEKQKREELAKKEQAELEAKRQAELAKKIAEEKQKKEIEAKKKEEEIKKQAELTKANTAATLELEQAKAAARAQKAIDEAKQKTIEMAQMRERGTTELQRQLATKITTPENSKIELNPTIDALKKEIKNELAQISDQKTGSGSKIPTATPEEENLLPKLRTLKTDTEKIKNQAKK